MDLKDEFIQIIKGILNFLLWILKMKQKNIYKTAFNASLSEVFITDTQDHQNKNKSKMDVFRFLKRKKYRTEMWFWKI